MQALMSRTIDANQVLSIYIASQGLIFLTLERCQRLLQPGEEFTEVDLYRTLSQPQVLQQLQEQVRAQIVMRTFEAANQAIQVAMSKMGSLEPFDASKAASQFLTQLEMLTKNGKNETNVNTFIWENIIPQEAVEAIRYLKQAQLTLPNIIEYNDDMC